MENHHEAAPDPSRCRIGIEGLDDILAGGLTRNSFFLIQGDPGSGKTTLALQFLMEGRQNGEVVCYVTLSETRAELLQVAQSHGWSIEDIPLLELSAIEPMIRPEEQTTVFHSSEMELNKLSRLVLEETARIKPARIVFDSLSEFRLIAESPLRYRRQLLTLKQEFAKLGSTVLLLDDKMDRRGETRDPHVLSLTHGVIDMEQLTPDFGTARRRLRVTKMRGVKFRDGYHDYVIHTGGIQVFPRLIAAEYIAEFPREKVSSGIEELDALFGGGLDRGTTTLLLGPAGTGKSTLALQFVTQMAQRRERGLIFTFDETMEIMSTRATALGLPLRELIASGTITARQVDPAELSPGEFVVNVKRAVDGGCRVVVIDSLNGYLNAMPGEKYLINQLHELFAYLNHKGVVTIMVMAQHGLTAAFESPVDLSYLCDMLVNLRYFESAGEVRQSVAVVKKRSGHHEKTIREFRIESGTGIRIGEPLREFRRLLGGAPIFLGGAEQMLNSG